MRRVPGIASALRRGRAPAALFGGPLADAIHALKYGNRPALSRPLGAWLAARVDAAPGRAGRVGAARPHAGASLAATTRPRSWPTNWRAPPGGACVGCGRRSGGSGRRRRRSARTGPSVPGTWPARSPPSGRVAGRDLLLVDDVVTTGATAAAAAGALREAGARSVIVIALARAE